MSGSVGKWVSVRTDAGYHLRLVGANGEVVLTSEKYDDPRSVQEAVNLVYRTVQQQEFAVTEIEQVDERTPDEVPVDEVVDDGDGTGS